MNKIVFRRIGIIHTPFGEPPGTPIQPSAAEGVRGRVEVFKDYSEGLKDLSGFSHIILIYYFHQIKDVSLIVKPFMDNTTRGVFSTRAPSRPNPIGISVVRLLEINDNVLEVTNLDIVDHTPLLDIKPFVPDFDQGNSVRTGWLESKLHRTKTSKDDGRFIK